MIFSIEGVEHSFGDRRVLAGLEVRLTEHRIGVLGANGSGKSTVARLLNGLVVPSRGRVLVDGLDTRTHGREVRRRVGFVFQNPDLQIVMPTVAEDVAFGLKHAGVPASEVTGLVEHALGEHGLWHLRDQQAHLLSGGEKQRLALVAVLVTSPRALVLDEPTTMLDLRRTREVAAVLAGLPQQVVLVTHDLDLLGDLDRVLVLDEGRLVHDGAPGGAVAAYLDLVSRC